MKTFVRALAAMCGMAASALSASPAMAITIYVSNLVHTENDFGAVQEMFAPYGKVDSIDIKPDALFNDNSTVFATVEMPNEAQALTAIRGVNGRVFRGKHVRVTGNTYPSTTLFYRQIGNGQVYWQVKPNEYCEVQDISQLSVFGAFDFVAIQPHAQQTGINVGKCGWPNGYYVVTGKPEVMYHLWGNHSGAALNPEGFGDQIAVVNRPSSRSFLNAYIGQAMGWGHGSGPNKAVYSHFIVTSAGADLRRGRTAVWTKCADEGGTCTSPNGATEIRYGANGIYATRPVTVATSANSSNPSAPQVNPCTNAFFGDPVPNVVKACEFR